MPPLALDHSLPSSFRFSILSEISSFLPWSSTILSDGRPLDSGMVMAWKSNPASVSWTLAPASLRQNTATTSFFPTSLVIWMTESPIAESAGRALDRDETVPTKEVTVP